MTNEIKMKGERGKMKDERQKEKQKNLASPPE